jgi:dihydrofolate synthase/folylpolyglutamate synthase
MPTTNRTSTTTTSGIIGTQRTYNEVIEFLDKHWNHVPSSASFAAMQQLDRALHHPSKKVRTVLVAGNNGKGLTIDFASQLLRHEKLAVGTFYAPHIFSYNERILCNNEHISNKAFTEYANEVLNTAQTLSIQIDSLQLLTMIALLHFVQEKMDVVLLEMDNLSPFDPTAICPPTICAITRVPNETLLPTQEPLSLIKELLTIVQPGTYVLSADQSKLNLQVMADVAKVQGGMWAMPIRKLAPLNYPFEQLHGRSAALAERICQIMIEKVGNTVQINTPNSLLAKQKGKRGRPTLEAKRIAEKNPNPTLEQFWKEVNTQLPGHFQILDKEKPTILLDTASNVDALENLLLGIRLLHYHRPHHRPLKGLTFIFACDKQHMHVEEFLRQLRYFSKKNSCQVIFCPIEHPTAGVAESSWDVEQIMNAAKAYKIKPRAAATFEEAFDMAKKSVDERDGLVVISGSHSIVSKFWQHKGIKKNPVR